MTELLTLTIPGVDGGTQEIEAPAVVPEGGLQGGDGESAVANGIFIFIIIIVVIALFFLIWGGIKWITSQGDKSKLDSARKTIIYAIVGLIVAFLSFFIINLVSDMFGFKFFGA